MTPDDGSRAPLHRAFDELRFGASRTLNLRAMQPTATQASTLAEQWLRSLQVQGAEEALVVTGRGRNSIDGYSPVREAIVRLLPSLRRRNVISGFAEHTAGSFVVTFAPVRALFDAPNRRREKSERIAPPTPATLAALDAETLKQLRDLSTFVLASLGVHSPTPVMVKDEMSRQFSALSAALPDDGDREALLQQAMQRALEEFERDR
ncbi:MAG TPA: hypothetical protein VE869_10535 [Gemmatimonas sp.]|nr:hypothetical protein [Gemmatimonas sp.]